MLRTVISVSLIVRVMSVSLLAGQPRRPICIYPSVQVDGRRKRCWVDWKGRGMSKEAFSLNGGSGQPASKTELIEIIPPPLE